MLNTSHRCSDWLLHTDLNSRISMADRFSDNIYLWHHTELRVEISVRRRVEAEQELLLLTLPSVSVCWSTDGDSCKLLDCCHDCHSCIVCIFKPCLGSGGALCQRAVAHGAPRGAARQQDKWVVFLESWRVQMELRNVERSHKVLVVMMMRAVDQRRTPARVNSPTRPIRFNELPVKR